MTVRDLVRALGAPGTIQIAAGGLWEEALSLDPSSPGSSNRLERWLAANYAADIGFEYLFEQAVFGMVVVGLRLPNDRTAREIVRDLAGGGLARAWDAPRDGVDRLERLLRVSEPLFFSPGPDLVALGVFNRWSSAGPITLFRRAASSQAMVSEWPRPASLPGALHPILLEVSYPSPVRHWIGVQVSDERDGLQVVSERKLATARSLAMSVEVDRPDVGPRPAR